MPYANAAERLCNLQANRRGVVADKPGSTAVDRVAHLLVLHACGDLRSPLGPDSTETDAAHPVGGGKARRYAAVGFLIPKHLKSRQVIGQLAAQTHGAGHHVMVKPGDLCSAGQCGIALGLHMPFRPLCPTDLAEQQGVPGCAGLRIQCHAVRQRDVVGGLQRAQQRLHLGCGKLMVDGRGVG